jgi:hypothetical protein
MLVQVTKYYEPKVINNWSLVVPFYVKGKMQKFLRICYKQVKLTELNEV